MMKIKKNIQSWYAINLVEGEGAGTAYEYYVKIKKLNKFINTIGKPKRILIAGLPEKYGLSMDFIWLGGILNAETVIIDDRSETLERAGRVLSMLKSEKFVDETKISFIKTDRIWEFNSIDVIKGEFDLALSSEVLQRLDGTRETYISNLKNVAKYFSIFVPNRGNESHANLSGLKSLYLEELLQHCRGENPEATLYDYGYIDMPPFPPGLSRSQDKRDQAAKSRIEAFLMKGLEIYSLCENIIPKFIKKKVAHIAYVMAISQ
jgi:hypothetical protein